MQVHSITREGVGSIALRPNRRDSVHVDAAWSNSQPANLPTGQDGSTVLDIGRGVQVRTSAHLARDGEEWKVTHMSASQHPTRRALTRQQGERLSALLVDMVSEWAREHDAELEAAELQDRETAADALRRQIRRHEEALDTLRRELERCKSGQTFQRYPDLPTDR
jgi:hypothetical protein